MADPSNTPKKIIKIIQSGDYPAKNNKPSNYQTNIHAKDTGLPSPYPPPPTTNFNNEPPLAASSAPPTNPLYKYPPANAFGLQQPHPSSSIPTPTLSDTGKTKSGPRVFKPVANPTPAAVAVEDPKKAIQGFLQSDAQSSSSSSSVSSGPASTTSLAKKQDTFAQHYGALITSKAFEGYNVKIVDQVLTLDKYPGDSIKQTSSTASSSSSQKAASSSNKHSTTIETETNAAIEKLKKEGIVKDEQKETTVTNTRSSSTNNNLPSSSEPTTQSPELSVNLNSRKEIATTNTSHTGVVDQTGFTAFEKFLVFLNLLIFAGIVFSVTVLGKLLMKVHNKEFLDLIAWITEVFKQS